MPDRDCVELIVKRLISERRQRGTFFPGELFADPAWELLLALTLAQAQGRRTSITTLCNQVEIPASTALRWIAKLTDQGLFIRRDDETDKRRKFIELSPHAYAVESRGAGAPILWSGFISNMIPVILGNIVGGSILVGVVFHVIYRRGRAPK